MAAVKKSSKKRSKTPSKGFDKTRFKKTPTGPRKVSRYKATGPLKKELRKNAATKVPVRKKQQRRAPGDEELSLPAMNKITPAGVQKPTGKKKGKVFVEDPESMMTILAMVTAEKEGHIESKMVKARQMEEIREARRKEQERKEAIKKQKFEEVKDGLRKKRRRKQSELSSVHEHLTDDANGGASKSKKRVSFA